MGHGNPLILNLNIVEWIMGYTRFKEAELFEEEELLFERALGDFMGQQMGLCVRQREAFCRLIFHPYSV